MDAFLNDVAKYLYETRGSSLDSCALVFPNRRAGLFLVRYLSGMTDKPLWVPRIYTISDLMQELDGLQPADPLTLNFELYKVYRSVTGSEESIDRFYSWGEILLGDFDEVDKYMVDAESLFRNITGLRNIEKEFSYLTPDQIDAIKSFWKSFTPPDYSPQQQEFLRIWEALAEIYGNFRDHLRGKGMAWEGMIYRDVAGRIRRGEVADFPYERYFIIGFNALNECEKVLFDHLRDKGIAGFFWDYDEYWLSRPSHQAGLFMRENLKRYPQAGFLHDGGRPAKAPPEISVIAVPGNTGQAKLMSRFAPLFEQQEPFKTAVILPDEGLLMPLLSSLPGKEGSINITMGYPLKDTPLYGFIMQILSLHSNCRETKDEGLLFHHRDVTGLLGHPFFMTGESDDHKSILRQIVEQNLVYVRKEMVSFSRACGLVFRKAPAGTAFTGYLLEIIDHMVKNSGSGEEERGEGALPEIEIIYSLYTGINRLRGILEEADTEVPFGTLARLLQKVLRPVRIPFYGEPLGGVQVMGVLETRALDFENVIWLSMNEGVFPAGHHSPSFVPHSLRRGWGLPVSDHRDAVYAYYFYRTLKRAKRLILLYNTRQEGLAGGEMSRFIYQLRYDGRFTTAEKNLVFDLLPGRSPAVSITKTDDILKRLRMFTVEGKEGRYLSPTAINSFIDCPLRFYFRYVAGLREPDQVMEEVDLMAFGNLLHEAAFNIYRPFGGKIVTGGNIDDILSDTALLEGIVGRAFGKVTGDSQGAAGTLPSGMKGVISRVLLSYLKRLLERDREIAPFRVRGLERMCRGRIGVETAGGNISISIGGVIDRIDEVNGTIRVADYKTGGDEASFSGIESLFERGSPKRRKAVFQTFLYCWLYISEYGTELPVSPVLYQVRKLFGEDSFAITESRGRRDKKEINDFSEYMPGFEANLKTVLAEMFDPGALFCQTEEEEICKFCPYKIICHR